MRSWHALAFLLTVLAGCSGNSSSSGGGAGTPDAAPAGGGRGGGQGTAGSGGTGGNGGSGGQRRQRRQVGGRNRGECRVRRQRRDRRRRGWGGGGGRARRRRRGRQRSVAANPASVIWYADPAKGNAVFKNVETEGGCTVTVIDDPQHGKVRKFNRPPGTNRCEAKGAAGYDTKEGDLVYVGMRYKIEAPMDLTVTGIFQWKTYDTPGHPNTLNFPLLLRPSGGRLNVEVQKPATAKGGGGLSGGTVIWSIPTPIGQWFTIVLGIKQSYDPKVGWVEVYYNGQQQKLSDGSMRLSCQTWTAASSTPSGASTARPAAPSPSPPASSAIFASPRTTPPPRLNHTDPHRPTVYR